MFKESAAELFEEFLGGGDLRFEALKAQLRAMLTALNRAISSKDKNLTAGCAKNLAQTFLKLRSLAVSNGVCNEVVGLMNQIAEAMTATDLAKRTQAGGAVEAWHQRKPKVILDLATFKALILS